MNLVPALASPPLISFSLSLSLSCYRRQGAPSDPMSVVLHAQTATNVRYATASRQHWAGVAARGSAWSRMRSWRSVDSKLWGRGEPHELSNVPCNGEARRHMPVCA